MNPRVPADYHELARWLEGFARAHGKREDTRVEPIVDSSGPREGQSYGLRLGLTGRVFPPAGTPPIELTFAEVAEGRARFAWCAALADRVRDGARRLASGIRSSA